MMLLVWLATVGCDMANDKPTAVPPVHATGTELPTLAPGSAQTSAVAPRPGGGGQLTGAKQEAAAQTDLPEDIDVQSLEILKLLRNTWRVKSDKSPRMLTDHNRTTQEQ
jgi:hypothetical protein